jgi:dihydroorotate dehydrogenase (NAD+) catalytic subunit
MGMNTLGVKIGSLVMDSPVVMASGIFGYGEINVDYVNYKKLGAIVTKTVSLKPRKGNPQPRIWETSSGMINSVGLQNPGVKDFIKNKLPSIKRDGVKVIISIMGENEEEISKITEILMSEKKLYNAIELNLSCPNVNRNKIMASQSPEMTGRFVKTVKKVCGGIPLIVKLSPNVTDITEISVSAEEAGADALSMINTVKAIAVDIKNNRIIEGGLSGTLIKPIGLKAVYDVYKKSKVPIIGIGGITTGKDAIEYIMAGASAVGLGSGFFSNPFLVDEVYDTLSSFLRENKFKNILKITGLLNEKEGQKTKHRRNQREKRV